MIIATYDTVLHTNSLSRNVLTWLGSIAGVQAAGGYVAAQLGAFVAGPLGFFLGGITGYTLEYIISYHRQLVQVNLILEMNYSTSLSRS